MIAFTIKNDWHPLAEEVGEANGYVALPKAHKYYGVHYDNIPNIDIHGGLTYSGFPKKLPWLKEYTEEYWVVGFDTAHHGDTPEKWPEPKVFEESLRLKEQLGPISRWQHIKYFFKSLFKRN